MKTVVDLVTSLKTYFLGKDTDAKQAVEAVIAPVETDATSASQSYAIGEQLILNDVLYKAKTAITAGDALVVNTNIEAADDIAAQIGAIDTSSFVDKDIIDTEYETIGSAALYPHTDGTVFFGADGNLYKATTDIAVSDTLTVGTNCALDNVVGVVNDLEGDVTTLNSAIANKVSTSDIINNLTETTTGKVLDATQGKALNDTITNKHKVSSFEVTTSSWTSDTTSQSGSTLYKKSIALSHAYVESPSVDIGAASGSVLPTTAQQTAYDLLQYVTLDGTTLYLYASGIPTDAFYINVEGVD